MTTNYKHFVPRDKDIINPFNPNGLNSGRKKVLISMAVKNLSMYFQQNSQYQRVSLKCLIPHTVNSHMTRFVCFLFALREEEDCKKASTEKVIQVH